MNRLLLIKVAAFLIFLYSLFLALPAAVALYYGEYREFRVFSLTMLCALGVSGLVYLFLRRLKTANLTMRDGVFLVSISWLLASFLSSAAFIATGSIPSPADAFFESVSGLSTTGASILVDVEALPRSVLFLRSLNHWIGGMGIVVLAVAVLPLLGVGGMQLVQAESPGPTVDKITPRISGTAKRLWFIYAGLSAIQTILLMTGGMDWFDASIHSFGTLATGGFSSKNKSVGHYESAFIDAVVTVFMVLAGINFTLHYRFITGRLKSIARDTEFKAYIFIFAASTLVMAAALYGKSYGSFSQALRFSSFQAASIMSSTGFTTADYEFWAFPGQFVLFLLMFVGGCSGSTAGGIKVFRIVTLLKQAINEMKYLMHPRGVFTLRMGGMPVGKEIVFSVSGFFFLYLLSLLVTTAVIVSSGHDLLTGFSGALAILGNIGPGFGAVGPAENYSIFPDYVKWFLGFAMLVGRLELYTVLVLLLPAFWRE